MGRLSSSPPSTSRSPPDLGYDNAHNTAPNDISRQRKLRSDEELDEDGDDPAEASQDAGGSSEESDSDLSTTDSEDAGSEVTPRRRFSRCPICLEKLKDRLLAYPDAGCMHQFCLDCLTEWSKNARTCPIDRFSFNYILVLSTDGEVLTRIDATQKSEGAKDNQGPDLEAPQLPEDRTECEVCRSGDHEESLLLCDGCDLAYHLNCCRPPLLSVPRGRWYCVTCEAAGLVSDYVRRSRRPRRPRLSSSSSSSSQPDPDADVMDQSEEEEDLVLPRTLEAERVRRAVVARRRRTQSSSTSSSKKTSSRRKKTTSRKKTTGKRSKRGSRKQKRRQKKSSGRGGKRMKMSKSESKRQKSADRSHRSIHDQGVPSLSLFGSSRDLDFYGDESLFVSIRPSTSASALESRILGATGSTSEAAHSLETNNQASEDLLSNLLAGQNDLLLKRNKTDSQLIARRTEVYTKASAPNNPRVTSSITAATSKTSISSKNQFKGAKNKGPCGPNSSSSSTASSLTPVHLPEKKPATSLADCIKSILKPAYGRGLIDKRAYRLIFDKCLNKVSAVHAETFHPSKVTRLVEAYVDKYSKYKSAG